MKVHLELEGATEMKRRLRTALQRFKGSKRPILDPISELIAEGVRSRLRAGVSPALTETSIRLRGGGGTPLIGGSGPIGKHGTGYGTLLGNIRAVAGESEAAAVVDDFRARFHQFGYTTHPDSAIPLKDVPARPFMLISQVVADRAYEMLADFVFEGFEDDVAA